MPSTYEGFVVICGTADRIIVHCIHKIKIYVKCRKRISFLHIDLYKLFVQ